MSKVTSAPVAEREITITLTETEQQIKAETGHGHRCVVCNDFVYLTFFNWLQKQRGAKR